MSTKSYISLFNNIDSLQALISKKRPLSEALLATIQEKLRIEWTYNSNAIEGNTLTLGETMFFLREGLTSEGRPLKDYLEAKNHAEAIDALYDIINKKRGLTESVIKELHGVLLKGMEFTYAKGASGKIIKKALHAGMYKTQPNHVLTIKGTIHHYADPLKVKDEMESLLKWYHSDKKTHVIEKAARFHYRFVSIHPFDDRNGRMARLLMNLILMQSGYTPAVIKNSDRRKYLEVLAQGDTTGDLTLFITFIAEQLFNTTQTVAEIITHNNSAPNLSEKPYSEPQTNASIHSSQNSHEREVLILNALKNKVLSIGQILILLPSIKRPTLKASLKKLVENESIKKKGNGKGVVYSL